MIEIQMAEFDIIEGGSLRMYANRVSFFVKPRVDGKFGYIDKIARNGRRVIRLHGTIIIQVMKGRYEDAEDEVYVHYDTSTPIANFDAVAFYELEKFINGHGDIFVNVSNDDEEEPQPLTLTLSPEEPSGGRRRRKTRKTRKGKAKLQ